MITPNYCVECNESWELLSLYQFSLTLLWRMSLSYRNQLNYLFCKSVDWFTFNRDLRHETIKLNIKVLKNWRFEFAFKRVLKISRYPVASNSGICCLVAQYENSLLKSLYFLILGWFEDNCTGKGLMWSRWWFRKMFYGDKSW